MTGSRLVASTVLGSYAKSHWPASFPRYASDLQDEISHYNDVLSAAIARHCTPGVDPDHDTRWLAHADAHGVFLTLLDGIPLLRSMYRLSMADVESYGPSVPYELPALNDGVYGHLTPLPEWAPLPHVPPQVQGDVEPL